MRLLCLLVLFAALGCTNPTPPTPAIPFSYTTLGMTVAEAEAKCGAPGTPMKHDDLPIDPKPRTAFPNLPDDVEWLYWGGRGNAIVILGVKDGKVVVRMTDHVLSGKKDWEGETLAKYK